MNRRPPRRIVLAPLLVAALAAACLMVGIRTPAAPPGAAAERPLWSPADGRLAARVEDPTGGLAVPHPRPLDPLPNAPPSPPSDDPGAPALRTVAPPDVAGGGAAAIPGRAGVPPGAGLASARFPTGPPPGA